MLSYHSIVCSLMDLASTRLNEIFSKSSFECDFKASAENTLAKKLKVSLQIILEITYHQEYIMVGPLKTLDIMYPRL